MNALNIKQIQAKSAIRAMFPCIETFTDFQKDNPFIMEQVIKNFSDFVKKIIV